MEYILAFDLGTGGNKTSLYDDKGNCLSSYFQPYITQYPQSGWHEQKPEDWWRCIVQSTHRLLKQCNVTHNDIVCCGISGHSLGAVPLDQKGNLLRETTPIWSDSRAGCQAQQFFREIPESAWYNLTGNGFPAALYSTFKIMWYRDHEPDMFEKIDKVVGTKDYINYKLTGQIVTDYSYASGSGVYDLVKWDYSEPLIEASGLPKQILPEIVASTKVIGHLTPEAATELTLGTHVQVVAGGVDNSCMALGAGAFKEGRVYNSLGSSSWIAVSSSEPLLSEKSRPYVFTHVIPEMFTSAVAIFSAGSSFRWLRDTLCQNLAILSNDKQNDIYDKMAELAATSPPGANKLLFNPSLAGGTTLHDNPNIRGAFIGLNLAHTQSDIIRSVMEGVAMDLRLALDELRKLSSLRNEMVVVGGGSRSALWRQIYADVYNMQMVKTNIDQQAAALGAAAVAAVGTGLWSDFETIDRIHQIQDVTVPVSENNTVYERLLPIFATAAKYQSDLGDMLAGIR